MDYIAEHSPDAADRIVAENSSNVRAPGSLSTPGAPLAGLTYQPLRFVVFHDFLLAYAPDELPVWVVAVLHGRRNPRILAAMLRDKSLGAS